MLTTFIVPSRRLSRTLQNPARLATSPHIGASMSARTFGLAVEIDIEIYMRLERCQINGRSLALACFRMQVHRVKLERRLGQIIRSGADRASDVFCYGFYAFVQHQRLIGEDDIS